MAWDDDAVKKRLDEGAKLTAVSFDSVKISKTALKVLDLLKAETASPVEGYAVLMVLVEA